MHDFMFCKDSPNFHSKYNFCDVLTYCVLQIKSLGLRIWIEFIQDSTTYHNILEFKLIFVENFLISRERDLRGSNKNVMNSYVGQHRIVLLRHVRMLIISKWYFFKPGLCLQ